VQLSILYWFNGIAGASEIKKRQQFGKHAENKDILRHDFGIIILQTARFPMLELHLYKFNRQICLIIKKDFTSLQPIF
jgi:hypothetical protein